MTASRTLLVLAALAALAPATALADPSAAPGPNPASGASGPAAPAPGQPAPAQSAPGKSARVMHGNSQARGAAATPDISCPGDATVWVNPRSKAYHVAGDPFFGRTRHGRFMCRKAADAAGDHPVPPAR